MTDIHSHTYGVRYSLPIIIVGIIASVLTMQGVQQKNEETIRAALQQTAQHETARLQSRLHLFEYGLRSIQNMVNVAGTDFHRSDFIRYDRNRNIENEFPGVRGFGFIRRVPQNEEAAFAAAARADGWPNFSVRYIHPHGGDRFVIQYIEPVARNREAVGLDIASEPNRNAAAIAAMENASTQLSAPITPVQLQDKARQGFLMLRAIYSSTTPSTVSARKAECIGWSYALLISDEVIHALNIADNTLLLTIQDVTDPLHSTPFYSTRADAQQVPNDYSQTIALYGRQWQITFTTTPQFIAQQHLLAPQKIFWIGIAITLLAAAAIGSSLTARSRNQQMLQQQRKLAAIVENSRDAIISKTLDGKITSWNAGAELIFGYNAKEAIGHSLAQLIIPPELEFEETNILQSIANGEIVDTFETKRRHRDGHIVSVAVSAAPIYDDDKKIIGISKTARDISARKLYEREILAHSAKLDREASIKNAEIHRLNRLFSEVLSAASEVSIIATDPKGLITVFNSGAERMLGYSAAEMIGKYSPAIIHLSVEVMQRGAELSREFGQTIEGFRAFVHIAEIEGSEVREWTYVRKDGSHLTVSLAVTTMHDDDDNIIGYLGIGQDVTERNSAQAKLADALAFSEAMLGTAVNPIITIDSQGLIRTFNPAASTTFGYLPEEVIGQNVKLLMPMQFARDHDSYLARFRDYAPTRAIGISREITARRKDGSEIPVQISLGVMHVRGERLVVGIFSDMTALYAQRDQLKLALDAGKLGMWHWDVASNKLEWNERMFDMYQQSPALADNGLNYSHWRERIHPDDVETAERRLRAALRGEDEFDPTFRLLRPDNSVVYIRSSALIERDENGNPLRVSGINWDVTDQIERELEIREARDQLTLATEAAELGIFTWDLISNALVLNDRMYEIYQFEHGRFGRGRMDEWLACLPETERSAFAERFTIALESRQRIFNSSYPAIRRDGSKIFVQSTALIQRDENGKAIRVIGVNRDISAQIEHENSLLIAKEQADAANQAKSAFLANMSHEIRTPMNGVIGMLQLVSNTGLNERQRDYVAKAQNAARTMLALLNDILDFSKIEAGKLELDLHIFSLEQLLRDLGVVLTGNLGAKPVEVIYDIDTHIPDELIGDSLRLRQVLINLAGNALKFTESGYVLIRIDTLATENRKTTLRFSVIDSGIGISPDRQQSIFESFSQAEASTSRRFGGTGLGLAICQQLIELMGGHIQVESETGKGSTFWFDLELSIATATRAVATAPESLRVLIVDDIFIMRDVLTHTAAGLGWEATAVSNGADAIAEVCAARDRGNPYHLILMDWRMPELDGISTAKIIRDDPNNHAPIIIMVSAYGREVFATEQPQQTDAFADVLTKPITPHELAETVQRIFNGTIIPSAKKSNTSDKRLNGINILVVEDNALNRQISCELLQHEGACVTLARNGEEGIDAVCNKPHRFDIVLMDMQMPIIDGLEATRRIRIERRFEHLPILAMTANASVTDRELCINAGMNDHIGKPLDVDIMVAAILRLTRNAQFASAAAAPIKSGESKSDNNKGDESENPLIQPLATIQQRFGGKLDLVKTMLPQFKIDAAQLIDAIAACAPDHLPELEALLHALKGTAGTIGAVRLSQQAATLEHAVKTGAHIAPSLSAQTLQLRELLEKSCAEFRKAIALSENEINSVSAPATTPAIASIELTSAELRTQLLAILPLLDNSNMRALDLVDALPKMHSITHYQQLVARVQALNFSAARSTLQEWIDSL